jgi:hypothetical protein
MLFPQETSRPRVAFHPIADVPRVFTTTERLTQPLQQGVNTLRRLHLHCRMDQYEIVYTYLKCPGIFTVSKLDPRSTLFGHVVIKRVILFFRLALLDDVIFVLLTPLG